MGEWDKDGQGHVGKEEGTGCDEVPLKEVGEEQGDESNGDAWEGCLLK